MRRGLVNAFPRSKRGDRIRSKLALRAEALSMLMDGIDMLGAKMRPGVSASEQERRSCLYCECILLLLPSSFNIGKSYLSTQRLLLRFPQELSNCSGSDAMSFRRPMCII